MHEVFVWRASDFEFKNQNSKIKNDSTLAPTPSPATDFTRLPHFACSA
jgi:hypothetical protein